MNNYYQGYYPNNYNINPYNQFLQQQQQNIATGLNGKIVDSQDVVRATEVPIGSYGVFPKADLSEIYIKSWNNNGTTSIVTFKPEINGAGEQAPPQSPLELIMQRLSSLEKKIDNITILNSEATEEKKEEGKEFKF